MDKKTCFVIQGFGKKNDSGITRSIILFLTQDYNKRTKHNTVLEFRVFNQQKYRSWYRRSPSFRFPSGDSNEHNILLS